MRPFVVILFLLLYGNLTAQQKKREQQLYYFVTSKNLVGIKDRKGRIIIPASHLNFPEYKNNEPVGNELIYLMPAKANKIREPHSWGVVYNRKGKLLFAPFAYDNGPDNFNEGLMRFVKNGKTGFANRRGEVVIPAQYDFALPFNYDISAYCMGCKWESDGEHSFVSGGTWGYINKKGEALTPMRKKSTAKDQKIDSLHYIPYQFTYSASEKKLLEFFNKQTLISKAHFVNFFSPLDSSERQLYFEIVERPSDFFPYYHVKAFELSDHHYQSNEGFDWELNYYVTKNKKKIFLFEGEHKIPFSKWLKTYVAEAKKYLKENPEALYKF